MYIPRKEGLNESYYLKVVSFYEYDLDTLHFHVLLSTSFA